jgi:hypothetical protein
MKKLLTLAALIGTVSLSFGQGYLNFQNSSTTRVSTNGTALALAGGATTQWYYALLYAPSTQQTVDASLSGYTFSGLIASNTASAGRLLGNDSVNAGQSASIAALTASSTADFVVVGWSANLGSDWNTVFAGRPQALVANTGGVKGTATWSQDGWYGVSTVAQDVLLAPQTGPWNSMFGASPLIPNMTLSLYQVPEPASFALMGLGGAALMIFRRRK